MYKHTMSGKKLKIQDATITGLNNTTGSRIATLDFRTYTDANVSGEINEIRVLGPATISGEQTIAGGQFFVETLAATTVRVESITQFSGESIILSKASGTGSYYGAVLSTNELAVVGDVSTETSRATSAELSLSTTFSTDLSGEVSRATSAELSLSTVFSTDISGEVSRATSAELSLSTTFSTDISGEVSRATSAELSLSTTFSTDISGELSRATSAELSLSTTFSTDLSGEVSRATSAEIGRAHV